MSEKENATSVSHDRRIVCYPPPKYENLFRNFTTVNEMTMSEAASHMIQTYFDKMPETDRVRFLKPCQPVKVRSGNHYQ